jgi:hypothetical protein
MSQYLEGEVMGKKLQYKTSQDGKTSWGQSTGKAGFVKTERVQTHNGGRTTEYEYKALGPGGRGRRVSR